MAKGKQTPKAPNQDSPSGIPRTRGAALKLGHKTSKHSFKDLSQGMQGQFMQLAGSGARVGSLCGVGPSPNDGFWLVCYKDESMQCHWVDVPKGQPIPHEG